jgi:scyllo-inositol 2-dehydrogenase (NADP+)
MVRLGLIGLGKMGISHLAIANTHCDAEVAAVCDPNTYVIDGIRKFTKFRTYPDYRAMLQTERLDAVIVATPSGTHQEIVQAALDRDISVFCEKPFCLDPSESRRFAAIATARGLANQVGYHARFLATFREAKRILDSGVLGRLHHVKAEAYGGVVLRPARATWRGSRKEGGGCLYDYASHAVDLVNYLVGAPEQIAGTALSRIFSSDVEDAVCSTLLFQNGMTGQIEANWSDESYRKMFIRLTIWGTNGRITADRQEIQTFIRTNPDGLGDIRQGWTMRSTTDLTDEVWYYLRGEEYSAQLDYFVDRVKERDSQNISSFDSAAETDRVLAMIVADGARNTTVSDSNNRVRSMPAANLLKWAR